MALIRIHHRTPIVVGVALPADIERVELFADGDGVAQIRIAWHHKDDDAGKGYANGDVTISAREAGMEKKLADALSEFVASFLATHQKWTDAGFEEPMRLTKKKG